MTAAYEKHGLSFLYPENWELEESIYEESIDISLQSPDGAQWSLSAFPIANDPHDVAVECLQAMQAVYPELESFEVDETLFGLDQTGFDLSFFCLDLLISVSIRTFQLEDYTVCITCQAENREFDALLDVFRAVTISLMQRDGAAK